jgi:gluconolactonase
MEQEDLRPSGRGGIARRALLTGAAATVASEAFGRQQPQQQVRDYGPGASPVRYPDADIVTLDPRFNKYKLGNTAIQRLYTGTLWAEGPAWNAVGRYLVWSDIPNNVQHRWLADDGHVSVFRNPRTTATATRSIGKGARSPANTARAAWSATSTTGA